MNWYEIRLTKGQIRDGTLTALQNEFKRLWHLVGERKEMALFAGTQHEKRNGQRFYISPGSLPWAESIITHYFASPCDKPTKTEVTPKLLFGHPESQGLIE